VTGAGGREVWRMRRDLAVLPPPPGWPGDVAVREFDAEADAAAVHALLERAYANGGGSVAGFELWLPAMTGDSEYDPRLWFVAVSGDTVAGVALNWTSSFVKDLAVEASWRGRGLGTALLRHTMHAFARRGAAALDLKVEADNPSGAVRLYEREGFRLVERLRV
jgi:ribosomal protein S18 acetylase RimI-like enzyme